MKSKPYVFLGYAALNVVRILDICTNLSLIDEESIVGRIQPPQNMVGF